MLFNKSANVGDFVDFAEEASMRAWHVLAHLVNEAVWRCFLGRVSFVALLLSRRPMFDAKNDVEELNGAALGVAAAGELHIALLVDRATVVEDYTVWQACVLHVLATSEVGTNAVVKDVRVAIVVHLCEKHTQLVHALSEVTQGLQHNSLVATACSRDSFEHHWNERRATGLNGHADEVEPLLVHGSSKCVQHVQVGECVGALCSEHRLPVPKDKTGIGSHRRKLELVASLQERNRDGWRDTLCGLVTTPDVRVRNEAKDAVCSAPLLRVLQSIRRQDRQLFHNLSQSLAQDETL